MLVGWNNTKSIAKYKFRAIFNGFNWVLKSVKYCFKIPFTDLINENTRCVLIQKTQFFDNVYINLAGHRVLLFILQTALYTGKK